MKRLAPSLLLAAALCAGCASAPAPPAKAALPMRGLSADETWEGEVRVRGSVVVPPGVTLTIRPGTLVRFERIDVDGDGIGDSELYVEGRLLAEGTPGRPVRFTSAEADPAPRDWKYLFLERSSGSVLRHCVSEYAFSGVQVHFSRAEIVRCTFRLCVDGLRFSTADGRFARNRMTGNVHGVRFEERGSRAEVEENEIAGNRIGVFCVTASKGTARFRGNAIAGNESYAFKMGDRQQADFPMEGNWWGTADRAGILRSIFDGEVERGLGRVRFEPFLAEPPSPEGGYGA